MKERTKNISIILAVLIVAAIGVAVKVYGPQKQVSAPDGVAVEKPYTNTKGEKWGPLPEGEFKYQVVSSEGAQPKFLQGFIDPLKVFPGLTQRMSVVVQSPAGIESVTAYIETDNGTTTVPLTRTGIVAARDMVPERYVVENEMLKVLSPFQIQMRHLSQIAQEESWFGGVAQAQNEGAKEAWSGEWVVRDTHERDYSTTFVARDKSGRMNSLTMAWSDPCHSGIPFSGNWVLTTACGVIEGITGVQNGQAQINTGGTMTLEADFAVGGTGALVSMGGGAITIGINGRIVLGTLLYMTDADADNYPPDINGLQYTSSAAGRRERRLLTKQNDCYDFNPNAFPGQTNYYTTSRGDGSFDYNCDGSATLLYATNGGQCDICDSPICGPLPGASSGWQGSNPVPACGENPFYDYIANPGYCNIDCVISPACESLDIAQACR